VANGTFYTDSGAADAYVLTAISPRQTPPLLTDGFTCRFLASAPNAGASTVNVGGFGVKDIKHPDGSALDGGDIGSLAELVYDLASGYFILFNYFALTQGPGSGLDADLLDGEHGAHYIDVPSGTSMLFVQAAAPTGWTKSVTHNNKALRIVNTAGGGSAGSNTFTAALNTNHSHSVTVNSHVLTTSEIPSHGHSVKTHGNSNATSVSAGLLNKGSATTGTIDSVSGVAGGTTIGVTGGGSGHVHTGSGGNTNLDIQYVDSIICTKD
jgi:hypothetical protein